MTQNNFTLIKSYVNDLVINLNTYDKKTSDLDLANPIEGFIHSQIAVQDRHDVVTAKENYARLSVMLTGEIKSHLNHMQKSFIQKKAKFSQKIESILIKLNLN